MIHARKSHFAYKAIFNAGRSSASFLAAASLLLPLCLVFAPESAFAQNAISTGTRSGFRMYYPGSNDWWLDPSHGNFDIRANGGFPVASFTSLGNLGIGTTSPFYPLSVQSSGGGVVHNSNIVARFQGNGSGQNATLQFSDNVTYADFISMLNGDLLFTTSNPGAVSALMIKGGGNVGVGLTNPLSKLSVGGSSGDIFLGQSGNGGLVRLGWNVNQAFAGSNQYYGGSPAAVRYAFAGGSDYINFDITNTATAGDITFNTAPSGAQDAAVTFAEAMRIKQNGSVGIGTTNPTQMLDVAGNFSSLQLRLERTGSALGGFNLGADSRGLRIDSDVTPQLMEILQNGYVGIGTTSPQGALDVNGKICLGGANCIASWPPSAGGSGAYTNLMVKTDATTPNTKVNISASAVATQSLLLANVSVNADVTVAGANGLQSGQSRAANTWYAVFIIANSAGSQVAGFLSTSQTPTLPSGYTDYRRVGWARTDAFQNFIQFRQTNNAQRYIVTPSFADPNGLTSFASAVPPTSFNAEFFFIVGSHNGGGVGVGVSIQYTPNYAGASTFTPVFFVEPYSVYALGSGYGSVLLGPNQDGTVSHGGFSTGMSISVLGYSDPL